MLTFQADTSNFVNSLQRAEDGDEICLTPGEYKGPFTIDRAVTIRGTGSDTIIWAVDEPALLVKVPGVRLKNLAIQRTVGGDKGEVVLSADRDTSPILDRVSLLGIAPNVQWEGAIWNIPTVLDFGELETNRQVERSWEMQLGAPCTIACDMIGLQVKNSHLSPGLQNLEFVLNSREIPAGTNLSGYIFLEASDGQRKIDIVAKIKQTSPPTHQEQSEGGLVSEDWGYRLLGSAVDNLIREVEGKAALESYSEFSERRDRAHNIMFEIAGKEAKLFYVRRLGQGQDVGEEKYSLTIATDKENIELPAILQKLKKTLTLIGVVGEGGYGGLRVLSARLQDKGLVDGFAVPLHIRLRLEHQYRIGVMPAVLTRMAERPIAGDRVPTEEQLKAWKAFLNIEERIAKTRQFCVPYFGHNYGSATRRITFEINASQSTIDKSSSDFLKASNFWERAIKARNEDIKLLELNPDTNSERSEGDRTDRPVKRSDDRWNAIVLGCIEEVDRDKGFIRVRLESEVVEKIAEGYYQLPRKGFLSFEAAGDLTQIKRKKRALEDLQRGGTQNPYLSEFFFDASKARSPQRSIKLQPENLLLPSANPDQIAAVEAVLAAPDLVLIQGPPGTGKTTVIAEICYQIALRGGRTLIASQANLAVDNALSRLIHSPIIRALRKGRAERVEEEGLPFLEDNAIATWLQNTAADCEKDIAKRRENIELFHGLLASSERFAAYLREEEAIAANQKTLKSQKESLDADYTALSSQQSQNELSYREIVEYLIPSLEMIVNNGSVNCQDPKFMELLARLSPYVIQQNYLQIFTDNVYEVVNQIRNIGLFTPEEVCLFTPKFGLICLVAFWLRQTVPNRIAEIEHTFERANEAIAALRETQNTTLSWQQNSDSVTLLQKSYQSIVEKQKNLQRTINSLEKQKTTIDSLQTQMKNWQLTIYDRVYATLLQNDTDIPSQFQLPLDLLNFVKLNSLPWQSGIDRFKSRILDFKRQQSEKYKIFPNIKSDLNRITQEVIDGILNKTWEWLNELQDLKKPQIKLVKTEVERWRDTTAYASIYGVLEQCVKNRQRFTDNLIQLPPGLLAIATVKPLPWKPTLDRCRSRILTLIRQEDEKDKISSNESDLSRITQEAIDDIFTSTSAWLNQQQAETERQLQPLKQQLKEYQKSAANQQKQISAAQKQLETLRHDTELKARKVKLLLQEIGQMPIYSIGQIAKDYIASSSISADLNEKIIEKLSSRVIFCKQQLSQLNQLLSNLDPLAVILFVKNQLKSSRLLGLEKKIESHQKKLVPLQNKIREIEEQLENQELPKTLIDKRAWWESAYQTIPDRLRPQVPLTDLFDLNFLRRVKSQFDAWQEVCDREIAYLNRYQRLVTDWIAKLRNPSKQDLSELRRIYIDNANVIGITCSQVAGYDFKEFNNFDVVIIDEVSKCTPPELLIPALKGKKLVLIGDYRQLPPMLHEHSLEEIAEEIGSAPEDVNFLEESLFKKQFELADERIKRQLTIQYRMHPTIMGAINQFYEHRLQCGILEPDRDRAHHLEGPIIKENHHLIWIKMPLAQEFEEKLEGTSRFNLKEIDAIDAICQQMEDTWSLKVAEGQPRKEIGIITFYGAQLRRIEEMLSNRRFPSLQIRTGTVDRFQGMERSVVIVSMVRNNSKGDMGFAKTPERVNVAFSRAQELLVIVGCQSLFSKHAGKAGKIYSEVSNIVRRNGGMIDVSSILS